MAKISSKSGEGIQIFNKHSVYGGTFGLFPLGTKGLF